MKLFIASDIHGSAHYTRLMLDLYGHEMADRIVLLGDILYHGPRNELPKDYSPKTVAAILNEYSDRIISVRGNCEAEVDSLMLDFPVTPDYGVIFDGSRLLYLSHGHRDIPKLPAGSAYITGHTHIPHDFSENGVQFINPGSVSIPKNNTPHSVCIYENGIFSWIDLLTGKPYSISK